MGTNHKNISNSFVENLNIPIPSIEDQEAIIKEMEYFDNLKEMYQTHIINTEKQIKERFEYHLNKCKNIVPKDITESKENNVDSETEDEEAKNVKRTKSSKSKKVIESDSEQEKPVKKSKSSKSKVEKELETDSEEEKQIKKSSKKTNKSTKKN